MKSLRLSVLAAALVLGACSSASPTDPAADASRPSFDGGNMMGSGTEDGGNTLGSGNHMTETDDATADDGSVPDPTQRGVSTMGSGG